MIVNQYTTGIILITEKTKNQSVIKNIKMKNNQLTYQSDFDKIIQLIDEAKSRAFGRVNNELVLCTSTWAVSYLKK